MKNAKVFTKYAYITLMFIIILNAISFVGFPANCPKLIQKICTDILVKFCL